MNNKTIDIKNKFHGESSVYLVHSRRSNGLSLGINLFTDKKKCNFNCPYCEVLPFSSTKVLTLEKLEYDLLTFLKSTTKKSLIKDVCFSGCGEPTLSPLFFDALDLVTDVMSSQGLENLKKVCITNGTGFIDKIFLDRITNEVLSKSLIVWVKIDSATDSWYKTINDCVIPFESISTGINNFFINAQGIIQTMICTVNGQNWGDKNLELYSDKICTMIKNKSKIQEIHLYTQSRVSVSPLVAPVKMDYLDYIQGSLQKKIQTIPIRIFGSD